MDTFRHRRQQAGLAYDLLPPERRATSNPYLRFERKPDVVDAEFVTVLPSHTRGASAKGPRAKQAYAKPRPTNSAKSNSAAAVSGLHFAENWLQRGSRSIFAALVVAVVVLVFGLAGGFSGLASHSTAATSEPLQFTHVTLTPRDENGMRVLLVNGIIENETGATLTVPSIRADVFSGDHLAASLVIKSPVDRIAPRESRGFSVRLQHPGGKTPDVRLSFLP